MGKTLKVAYLVSDEFEDLELWYPTLRLREAGVIVYFVGKQAKQTYSGKYGVSAISDLAFKDIDVNDYDGLLIPGGWAPDKLRRFPEVLDMVRTMDKQKKLIGTICHAGWVLSSAGILKGRKITSTPGIKDDMIHAGARWVDEPVVVDGNLISGRRPRDLPLYGKTLVDLLARTYSEKYK